MKTETHTMSPYMKLFFAKLLNLKEFVMLEKAKQKDPKTIKILDEIYARVDDIIKVNKEDLQ